MKLRMVSIILAASVLAAVAALAEHRPSSHSDASNRGATTPAPQVQTNAGAEAAASSDAEASVDVAELRQRIESRAARASTAVRERASERLEQMGTEVDQQANRVGSAKVAGRLAAEFGMTADQMIALQSETGASWGNLMIANSLAANATDGATVQQLLALKSEGKGWGEIAAGLGLELGSVVSSVQAETRVAKGLAKADARVAAMRGEGARTRVGATVAVGAGLGHGAVNAHGHTGVGVGVKIK